MNASYSIISHINMWNNGNNFLEYNFSPYVLIIREKYLGR